MIGEDGPLLPASTGTRTTELLGLHASRVCDQECSVIRNQLLLQLHRAERIDVFCVVCYDRLCNCLTDGIDLGSVSTTLDADTDVEDLERVFAGNEDGLVDLEAQDLRLHELYGGAVNTDKATALFGMGYRCGSLIVEVKMRSRIFAL